METFIRQIIVHFHLKILILTVISIRHILDLHPQGHQKQRKIRKSAMMPRSENQGKRERSKKMLLISLTRFVQKCYLPREFCVRRFHHKLRLHVSNHRVMHNWRRDHRKQKISLIIILLLKWSNRKRLQEWSSKTMAHLYRRPNDRVRLFRRRRTLKATAALYKVAGP